MNLIQILFKNFDESDIWDNINEVRTTYIKDELFLRCKLFGGSDTLKTKLIINNFNNLSSLFAVKNVSDETRKLAQSILTTGAKMFIHLNSCPTEPIYWRNLFVGELLDASISKFYLTTLKIFKTTQSNDAKIIAYKILQKLSSFYPMKHIFPEKSNSGNKKVYKLTQNLKMEKGFELFE